MQIRDLQSTSTVESTDYLVKEQSDGTTQKIAVGDFVVNDPTSTATDKPGSANMIKTLNDKLTDENFTVTLPSGYSWNQVKARKTSQGLVYISGRLDISTASQSKEINLGIAIPEGCRPQGSLVAFAAFNNTTDRILHGLITTSGNLQFYRQETENLSTIVFTVMYTTW